MRELADARRIERFMRELGRRADVESRVYFTGGATAVLHGWRPATIDVDVKLVPESDRLLRALPGLKEALRLNVELASPVDFIPVPDGWEERGSFIHREGQVSFFHFDFYAQALAKAERSHAQDVEDIEAMIEGGLVVPERALEYFERIEPELYRYPAIDGPSFRGSVEKLFRRQAGRQRETGGDLR